MNMHSYTFDAKKKTIILEKRKNAMIEKKVNEANRSPETTRHLKRRSPRDRIKFISKKKENKIEINKTKINKKLILYCFMKKGSGLS